jgi:hypothetical protein
MSPLIRLRIFYAAPNDSRANRLSRKAPGNEIDQGFDSLNNMRRDRWDTRGWRYRAPDYLTLRRGPRAGGAAATSFTTVDPTNSSAAGPVDSVDIPDHAKATLARTETDPAAENTLTAQLATAAATGSQ